MPRDTDCRQYGQSTADHIHALNVAPEDIALVFGHVLSVAEDRAIRSERSPEQAGVTFQGVVNPPLLVVEEHAAESRKIPLVAGQTEKVDLRGRTKCVVVAQ